MLQLDALSSVSRWVKAVHPYTVEVMHFSLIVPAILKENVVLKHPLFSLESV